MANSKPSVKINSIVVQDSNHFWSLREQLLSNPQEWDKLVVNGKEMDTQDVDQLADFFQD